MTFNLFFVITVGILSFVIGAFIVYLYLQKQLQELRETNTTLTVSRDLEHRAAEEREQSFIKAQQHLSQTFSALAGDALNRNNETFLKLAQENLKQFQIKAQGDLTQKEKSIENLVKPIKEALDKTEAQIRMIEKERKEAYGSLSKHLETMAQTQQLLHGETRNLVQALRRPEVRGQWGEMTLKRLAELAGMVEHCDFYEQLHVKTEEGAMRPDMIVRMPDGREIVVDAKTPLDAYLSAIEAADDVIRKKELERHARNLRTRVRELSAKAYWNQFKNAPDFVVLFIPGEQFLSAALDFDRNLLEEALAQKVILSTPTSFVALLRAVAYGWRQESLAENAEHIRTIGEELYQRLATFSDYLAKLGKSLDSSVANYNKAVGSFDARILPSARKFTDLGLSVKKPIETIEQIEKSARQVEPSPVESGQIDANQVESGQVESDQEKHPTLESSQVESEQSN